MQVSELADLIVYRTDVVAATDNGRKPGPSSGHHTIEYVRQFVDLASTGRLIQLHQSLGASTEI